MKSFRIAALVVAFTLCIAGTAGAEALNGDPAVVHYATVTQDLRSPDAASAGQANAPVLAAPSDEGMATIFIVLLATAGVVTVGTAAYTLRRTAHTHRHTIA